jgi:DNA gyrase/topoisomerase IV subunit A
MGCFTIKDGDELLEAKLTNGESQIILAVKSGKLVRFEETKTRPMGRTASEFAEYTEGRFSVAWLLLTKIIF